MNPAVIMLVLILLLIGVVAFGVSITRSMRKMSRAQRELADDHSRTRDPLGR